MDLTRIPMDKEWSRHLSPELKKDYMSKLSEFLKAESSQKKSFFPQKSQYFEAFNKTPLSQVKVVILGQDPYHGEGQAHGLCFSVKPGVRIPPSLVNIYKELQSDLNIEPVQHGCLEAWAKQGVLLLNATLTVEAHKAGSHQKKGWEQFTDQAIEVLNKYGESIVFLLWGSYAQKKGRFIDEKKHLVLKSVHPSPLSAYRGFLGCQHFSKANQYLQKKGREPINWQLPKMEDLEL